MKKNTGSGVAKKKRSRANIGMQSTASVTGAQRRKPKAPQEAHTNKKLQTKNNPFKVKAFGGAPMPAAAGAGRPQGEPKKKKVGRNRRKR